MEKEEKNVVLKQGKDYTPSKLRDLLNTQFGEKKSGKKFTNQDIYQYAKRGYLPDEYGGLILKHIDNDAMGVKVLRLFPKK